MAGRTLLDSSQKDSRVKINHILIKSLPYVQSTTEFPVTDLFGEEGLHVVGIFPVSRYVRIPPLRCEAPTNLGPGGR